VFKTLDSLDLKFVIVGNTALLYALGERVFDDDIDLFIYEGSSMAVEDDLRSIASKKGWDIGQTDMGTPSIIYKLNDQEVIIELYESFYDFYIPLEIARESRVVNIGGYYIRMVTPEQYLVLKARS
jgi:predicted nucleotidyltransferase